MKTAGDIIREKNKDIVWIDCDQSVHQAAKVMVSNKIGAILVKKNNAFVGIWTERDLLRSVAHGVFNPETARIADHMTTTLHSAPCETPLPKLEDMFLGLFVRHLLVEKDGQYIGLLSIGDVTRANLLETDNKYKALHSFASWEYYEDWRWGRKKK